jgi:hypothetical protein
MGLRLRIAVASALTCGALAAAIPASGGAALAPITGQLSAPGYTVVALAPGGKATSVRAGTGKFRLRPPAARATLHLRARNGVYAGPVVMQRALAGRRVIVGVRSGAKLGRIDIKKRYGYALVRRAPALRWIDRQLWGRARKGVPLGARNFGRVRSRPPSAPPLGDLDVDAIPDLLDIDDDGDLILDKLDRPRAASTALTEAAAPAGGALRRAMQARETVIDDQFLMHTTLTATMSQATNANAAGLSLADMDAALSAQGLLMMGIIPGDAQELDCGQPQSRTDPGLGGLIYCSRNGTGRLFRVGTPFDPFPDAFDPDGDGLGTMTPSNPDPAPGSGQLAMFLRHGATSAQIGTGDLLIQRVVRNGQETQYPATIQYVFATVPALVSYSDGQGNAGTLDYSPASREPGARPPGSFENPLPVAAPAGAPVTVNLTFWRPQRRSIPPEAGEWTDIGGLNHSAAAGVASCPQTAFSEGHAELRPLKRADVFPADYNGVRDLAPDRAANAGNTFTYRLDLTQCASAAGVSFEPGETRTFTFQALTPNGTDSAVQQVAFTRR